jgi:hypothetical protein
MAKRTDVLAHLPGFKRVYTIKDGKKTNQRFISEDGNINLSVRQAQEVAKGKKTLSEATSTSFKGKKVKGLGWKVPTTSYQFKDLFDARDFVLSNKSEQHKQMFLTAKGKPGGRYKTEGDGSRWLAPLPVVNPNTYQSDKYWEKIIDQVGLMFEGDPSIIAITYIG